MSTGSTTGAKLLPVTSRRFRGRAPEPARRRGSGRAGLSVFESSEKLAGDVLTLLEALRRQADGRYACVLEPSRLLFESPAAEVERLRAAAVEVMESALSMDVPLKVDVKVGDDWAAV